MARILTQQTKDYLKNLTSKKTEESERLYYAVLKLRDLDEDAFSHCTYLIYSYKCPVEVAFLAFDISYKQLMAGKNANPQRIFQSLSRNDRASYEAVKKLYDDAVKMLEKFVAENKLKETINIDEKNDITEIETEKALQEKTNTQFKTKTKEEIEQDKEAIMFADNFLYENYFRANDDERYVVNTCVIPKNAWLLNVYATSYKDYCNIVQNTLKEFNDAGVTVLLTKPELFKNNKISKENPKIAYSIIAGEHFGFSSLSEKTIMLFDGGEEIINMSGIKIAKRVSVEFVSFVGELFMDNKGNVKNSSDEYIKFFANEEEILKEIDNIGASTDIVKFHIETKAGISQNENLLIYKSILCRKENIIQIASILQRFETGKLDFIINSNRDDIKILFVHISHFADFISELNNHNIIVDANPQFNEKE